ncbi:DUF1835 domain-containing protein [Bacillus pumilus]|uniref:DUF1835 domain-containing protein n=1 Tax=Bacillus pumilus TaxID=1408 RepID=UPI002DDBA116|nr:DUF1835 domain-containing protein [Bacillus pumilus]
MKQKPVEDVITFDDIYSIGPLLNLHEREGQEARIEWMRHVMSNEFGGFDDMVINTTIAYDQLFNTKTIRMDLRHTGEIPSEKFKIIYESKKHFHHGRKREVTRRVASFCRNRSYT